MCRNIKTLFNFDPPATDETAAVARHLIDSLVTAAGPRDREEVAAQARARMGPSALINLISS